MVFEPNVILIAFALWLRTDSIRFDWIRSNSFRLVMCIKPWPGTGDPFGDACPEPWLCTDLIRFDWIRSNSFRLVNYVFQTMARDRRPFWGRLSRTMALYRFDPIRFDSIQFRSDWLGVPDHGPGQATLLGTPVPNHGFVPI